MKRAPLSALVASLLLAVLALAARAGATDPVGFQMRPIDRATVRLIGISGLSAVGAQGRASGLPRVLARPDGGHGSGVMVRGDGVVLTARHVVVDADLIIAVLPGDDRARPARVIYSDPEHDVAFVAVEGSVADFVPLPAAPPAMHATERVSVSGYPLDETQRLPAATSGELARVLNDGRYQLAMALNPGNSGGPVIDEAGNILGIVTQGGDPSRGVQGIVIAEPIDVILRAWSADVERATLPSFAGVDGSVERDVAALVLQMVIAGPSGLAYEHGERDRLLALAARAPGPVALALMAAHGWDTLQILLEARRAADVDALPVAERDEGRRLAQTVLVLCQRAVQADPDVRTDYPFVAAVLAEQERREVYLRTQCGLEGNACCEERGCGSGLACNGANTCVRPVACGPGARCGAGFVCVAAVCAPAPRPRYFSLVGVAGPAVDTTRGTSAVDGGAADVLGLAHVYTAGTGRAIELQVLAGGDLGLGSWRRYLFFDATLDAGVRLRLGAVYGLDAMALYMPGYVLAEGRGVFAWAAYRVAAGFHYRGASFGVTWQEQGRAADSTFRLLGLYAEAAF